MFYKNHLEEKNIGPPKEFLGISKVLFGYPIMITDW